MPDLEYLRELRNACDQTLRRRSGECLLPDDDLIQFLRSKGQIPEHVTNEELTVKVTSNEWGTCELSATWLVPPE